MKVASVQLVSSADVNENLEAVKEQLAIASSKNVDIALLPETFLDYGSKQKFSEQEQQALLSTLSEMAASYGLWLIAGTFPLTLAYSSQKFYPANITKPYASSVTFDKNGVCQGVYSKIHLFDVDVNDKTQRYRESERYSHGDDVGIIESPWGNIGIAICYDLRFPEVFLKMAQENCKVVFIPAAFTEKTGAAHWEVLLRARAIESQCFIVASNQGGTHYNGQQTWGGSMIVNPWGEIVSKIDKGEGSVIADLDLSYIDTLKKQMPMAQHRRLV